MYKKLFYLLPLLLLVACQSSVVHTIPKEEENTNPVLLGIDNFILNHLDLIKNKRVGLLTNPSGVNVDLKNTSDILFQHPEINLTTLFGPEHGIRGAEYAGDHVKESIDPTTVLPVYSLYGSNRKPTPEMLDNVDVILIDIQDIGLRAYTYIYTMAFMMIAAKKNSKEIIVLDRPNPIGGVSVEGNLVEDDYISFVGLYPIPYRHGMTIGELALLFNSEYDINCQLEVIPLKGWKRGMYWEDTRLGWVPTSPHVPHWQTILPMIATGTIGELSTLSVGVGYTSPFEIVGAPWINCTVFAEELKNINISGVTFRPLYFKPYYGQFAGEICQGVQIHITDRDSFQSYSTGLHIMQTHMKLYVEKDLFEKENRIEMFDKVMGTDKIRRALVQNIPVNQIENSWQKDLDGFKQIREKYLIYKK